MKNLKNQYDPFDAENQTFTKAASPKKCKAESHNYGIRKHGFCARCNGIEMN